MGCYHWENIELLALQLVAEHWLNRTRVGGKCLPGAVAQEGMVANGTLAPLCYALVEAKNGRDNQRGAKMLVASSLLLARSY